MLLLCYRNRSERERLREEEVNKRCGGEHATSRPSRKLASLPLPLSCSATQLQNNTLHNMASTAPVSGNSTPVDSNSSVGGASLTSSLLRGKWPIALLGYSSRSHPAFMRTAKPYRFATQCATVDNPDPSHKDQHGSSSVPIYQTATFKGMGGQYDYTRSGNPTRSHLGTLLLQLAPPSRPRH